LGVDGRRCRCPALEFASAVVLIDCKLGSPF
jgi:hypothetical protein